MKKLSIILFLVLTSLAYSISDKACVFLTINPSTIGASFGVDGGTADLKHTIAISGMNNPALLGKVKGISADYSYSDYYYSDFATAQIAINYEWITISLPFYNGESKFGTTIGYDAFEEYNEEEETFVILNHTHETVQKYQLGISVDELFKDYFKNYLKNSDFYLGYSLNYLRSKIGIEYDENTFFHDFGLAYAYSNQNNFTKYDNIIFTFGFSYSNFTNSKISYTSNQSSEKTEDELPMGERVGVSLNYAIDLDFAQQYFGEFFNHSYFNLISNSFDVYTSFDHVKFADDWKTNNFGIEITVLDMFSYRFGKSYDIDQENWGHSFGYGINIPLHKNLKIYMDRIKIENQYGAFYPDRYNFGFNVLF
jgi:hypothetical protein